MPETQWVGLTEALDLLQRSPQFTKNQPGVVTLLGVVARPHELLPLLSIPTNTWSELATRGLLVSDKHRNVPLPLFIPTVPIYIAHTQSSQRTSDL